MTDDDKSLKQSWLESTEDSIPSSPALDPDEFREYVEDFDLSEEQENELLETLWKIMKTFVELGFGLDTVQNLFSGIVENALHSESDSVKENDHTNKNAKPDGSSI